MSENTQLTHYQKSRDLVLYKAKEYHKNNKDRLSKQARNKYNNLSEEETAKKRNCRTNRHYNMSEEKRNIKSKGERDRYHNMSEEKKTKKREYAKSRCKM